MVGNHGSVQQQRRKGYRVWNVKIFFNFRIAVVTELFGSLNATSTSPQKSFILGFPNPRHNHCVTYIQLKYAHTYVVQILTQKI